MCSLPPPQEKSEPNVCQQYCGLLWKGMWDIWVHLYHMFIQQLLRFFKVNDVTSAHDRMCKDNMDLNYKLKLVHRKCSHQHCGKKISVQNIVRHRKTHEGGKQQEHIVNDHVFTALHQWLKRWNYTHSAEKTWGKEPVQCEKHWPTCT